MKKILFCITLLAFYPIRLHGNTFLHSLKNHTAATAVHALIAGTIAYTLAKMFTKNQPAKQEPERLTGDYRYRGYQYTQYNPKNSLLIALGCLLWFAFISHKHLKN